jgi:hypothetical protein
MSGKLKKTIYDPPTKTFQEIITKDWHDDTVTIGFKIERNGIVPRMYSWTEDEIFQFFQQRTT